MENIIKTKLVGNTVVRSIHKKPDEQDKISEKEQALKDAKTKALALGNLYDLDTYRNEKNFMQLPLFSVGRKLVCEQVIFEYEAAKGLIKHITIDPNPKYGMPTQRDADILRYAISKLIQAMHEERGITNKVAFTRYEVLRAIGKDTGSKGYKWLEKALERLLSTKYKTNWFDSTLKMYDGTLCSIEYEGDNIIIQFPDCLSTGIKNLTSTLEIAGDVITEQGGLSKRLKEWIPMKMGKNRTEFSIGLAKLIKWNVPGGANLKRFKYDLQRLELPFEISYKGSKLDKQIVTFKRK